MAFLCRWIGRQYSSQHGRQIWALFFSVWMVQSTVLEGSGLWIQDKYIRRGLYTDITHTIENTENQNTEKLLYTQWPCIPLFFSIRYCYISIFSIVWDKIIMHLMKLLLMGYPIWIWIHIAGNLPTSVARYSHKIQTWIYLLWWRCWSSRILEEFGILSLAV